MKVIIFIFILVNMLLSQIHPTKMHVKKSGEIYAKYTSKLIKVIELNISMGSKHSRGKPIISEGLDRIAQTENFTVEHIIGGESGGEMAEFDLNVLKTGQVIVANNVSSFGGSKLGAARQEAIQTAIEKLGIGYLGFHSSGDNKKPYWPWFTNVLHPLAYEGHGSRTTAGKVYKHMGSKDHIILDGILEINTTLGAVPNEVDGNGQEIITENIPYRRMQNEWYKFGRDISTDPEFKEKVTILLKYDPRDLDEEALSPEYHRKGGNLYTYIYKIGKSLTSYVPAGHDNNELLNPDKPSFDGGTGDYDRYIINILYFLAGYKAEPCDAECEGLQIVTNDFLLTGATYTSGPCADAKACNTGQAGVCKYKTCEELTEGLETCSSPIYRDSTENCISGTKEYFNEPGFEISSSIISANGKHSIEINNVRGETVFSKTNTNSANYSLASYEPGVYFITISVRGLITVKRFLIQ